MSVVGPSHSAPIDRRALVGLAIVTLIWSSTWTVIRYQLGIVPPAWSVAYRFLTAAAIMLLFCVATGRSLRLGRSGHLLAIGVGLTQFLLNFNLVYQAERYVTSGVVAVVFALLLVPNAVFAAIFLKHPITARFALGSALGIAGVAMLFWHELRMAVADPGGVLIGLGLTIGAVVAASLGNVAQASGVALRVPVQGLLAMTLLYGALLDAAFAFASAGPPVFDPSPLYVGGFLYLGAFASAIAFNLYYEAIRSIGPARAAYSSLIVPFIAMGLSTLLEGYRWTLLAGAGAALAVVGLYVALSARR